MADEKDVELAKIRQQLAEKLAAAEGRTLEILAKERKLVMDYAKEYARVLAMSPEMQKNMQANAQYLELNAKLSKAYGKQIDKIAKQYGVVLDRMKGASISQRELLKNARDYYKAQGDITKAMEAQEVLTRMRAADVMRGASAVPGAFSKGGLTTGEVTGGLGKAAGSMQEAAIQRVMQQGLTRGTLAFGMGTLAFSGIVAAVTSNLNQLKDRIKSTSQGMATLGDMGAVKQEAMTYAFDVKNAAASHMIESEAVQNIADIMRNTMPGSIKGFLESTNDTTMSMQTVVQNARLLGISEQQSAQVLSDLYKMSARTLTGEERRRKATEELNLVATYARRSLNDNIMTTTDFTAQLDQAIGATSAFQTSAGSLGALMDSLSRIQSKSAPALGSVGEAAAALTNQMRGFSDPLRVVLGGGLKGIWGWAEMEPTEMMNEIKNSFLGRFVGMGPGASQEDKSIGLMVMRQFGLGEQQARWMIEMGTAQEATASELAGTRKDAKDAQDTFKDVQGGIAQLVKQGDKVLGYLSNISGKMVNMPTVK